MNAPLTFVFAPYDLSKFYRQTYRDGYLEAKVRGGVAYQIQALRGDLTQKDFAQKLGMKQSAISRLESTEYGKVTVQTLLKIAKRSDVALIVQFVSYPEFLDRTSDMSPARLKPETIHESHEAQRKHTLPQITGTWHDVRITDAAFYPAQLHEWHALSSLGASVEVLPVASTTFTQQALSAFRLSRELA